MNNNYSKNRICLKCKSLISNHSNLCRECANKEHSKRMLGKNNPMFNKKRLNITGKNHWNWKGGKPKCTDCKIEIKNFYAKRCKSCENKRRFKLGIFDNKGINHPLFGKKCPEHSERIMGKNNPNYINGEGNFPYPMEFNDALKESIRKRDNYECQNCGMTEEEHIIVVSKVLTVHHIDYNKENCSEDNLITLCNQCNLRANYNRNHWKEIYNKLFNIKDKNK